MDRSKEKLQLEVFVNDMTMIKEAIKKTTKASVANRQMGIMLIDGMILNARKKFKNNNDTNYVF